MHPVLLDWNGIILPAWHVMFALAAIAMWVVFAYLSPRLLPNTPRAWIAELFIVGYVGGYFGARALSIVIEENSGGSLWGFVTLFFSLGPMTFYGGAIGAAITGYAYSRWRRLPKRRVLDMTVAGSLLALGIGRVGCFLNGCDYGCVAPASHWWTVVPPVMGDGLARYPVQLIESLFGVMSGILMIVWCRFWGARVSAGVVGYCGIGAYAIFRFVIEYWRCDDRGWVIPEVLSPSQAVSIGLLVFVLVTMPLIRRQRGI